MCEYNMERYILASNSCDTQLKVPARVLIVRHELNEATRTRLEGLSLLVYHLKVDTAGCLGRDSTHFPCRGVANTDFSLSHRSGLFVSRHCMANQPTDLQLLGRLWYSMKNHVILVNVQSRLIVPVRRSIQIQCLPGRRVLH